MQYRKKPIVIDAVQWSGNNKREIEQFLGANIACELECDTAWEVGKGRPLFSFKINTLEGIMTASPGDYIIKGVNGEFYPCKPDIFDKSYEPVSDDMHNSCCDVIGSD